jgi:NADH:ubiquinone reductase (H+-translocating)
MTDGVVIVGGGFAGFWAAAAARRVARGAATVTLISQHPVLEIRPRLYEADPESLGVEVRPLLRSIEVAFVGEQAVGIDLVGGAVNLASGARLGYGRLVVATGSRLQRPAIRGASSAYSIDTQKDAIAFDARLAKVAASVDRPTVAIVGAGFTGIELALELRDRLAAHGGEALAQRARIVLIGRAREVGRGLGPGPRPVIESALNQARIQRRLGVDVSAVGPNGVTFADGTTVLADAVVLTTGLVAAPFAGHVPGDRDVLGRVIVDRALRAPAAPDIFVAGDAAAADTGDGHVALQSCQHALQMGRFAGENAARDLIGLPTLRYAQLDYDTCLDLGRTGAVFTEGWDRRVVESGQIAKARKRRINRSVIYPPSESSPEMLLAMSSTDPARQRCHAPIVSCHATTLSEGPTGSVVRHVAIDRTASR